MLARTLFIASLPFARGWWPSLEPLDLPPLLRAVGSDINDTLFVLAEPALNTCRWQPPTADVPAFVPSGVFLSSGMQVFTPAFGMAFGLLYLQPRVSAAGGELVVLADIRLAMNITDEPLTSEGWTLVLHDDGFGVRAMGGPLSCLLYTNPAESGDQRGVFGCGGCRSIRRSVALSVSTYIGALRLGLDGAFGYADSTPAGLAEVLLRAAGDGAVVTLRVAFGAGGDASRVTAGLFNESGELLVPGATLDARLPRPVPEIVGADYALLGIGASAGYYLTSYELTRIAAFSAAPLGARDAPMELTAAGSIAAPLFAVAAAVAILSAASAAVRWQCRRRAKSARARVVVKEVAPLAAPLLASSVATLGGSDPVRLDEGDEGM